MFAATSNELLGDIKLGVLLALLFAVDVVVVPPTSGELFRSGVGLFNLI